MKYSNDYFMQQALLMAEKAYKKNEVPIGAIIVKNNKIIAKAYNKRNKTKNAVHHAEIIAIEKACKKLKEWRLQNCVMYVTTLPCPMCAGAIVNARLEKVYYGATNENVDLFNQIMSKSSLNHNTLYEGKILEQQCSDILKNFFKKKR